ncbi:MAG: hypothetical protein ACP5IA_02415 [Sediminispirochaetaceae bacterium]
MHSLRKTALFIIIALCAVTFNLQAVEPSVELLSPRDAALGGRHVALTDTFSSLVNNPAGFYTAPEQLSITEITIGLKGPMFSLADAIIGGEMSDLSELINGIYAGLDLLGPLSFGYIGEGLGFGVYNQTNLRMWSNNSLTANVRAWDDIVLTGGYAYRMPFSGDVQALDAGVLLKGGFRGTIDGGISVVDIMELNVSTLLDEPFRFTSFIGMDLGLRYSVGEKWVFGMVGRDVYTPTLTNEYADYNDFINGVAPTADNLYDTMQFKLDLGMMYRPQADLSRYSISDIKILFDYKDLLDFWIYPELSTNPLLHISFGTEVTVMEILDVRLGFAEGLFAAGLGLDLSHFTMNVAAFGTERSTEPGLAPVYNLQLGLEFRK